MRDKADGEQMADLAAGLVEDAQRIVRLEIELAKAEAAEFGKRNGIAAGLIAGGALLALFGIMVGIPVLLIALGHCWVAFGVCAAYLLGGAAAVVIGYLRLQLKPPMKTVTSLKETKDWALRQVRSSSR